MDELGAVAGDIACVFVQYALCNQQCNARKCVLSKWYYIYGDWRACFAQNDYNISAARVVKLHAHVLRAKLSQPIGCTFIFFRLLIAVL